MLTVKDLTHEFDGQTLFKDVNLTFTQGNCYGIIGANGAGKSTLLKFISGLREPTKGEIFLDKNARMSVLEQDHFKFDEYFVMETVIMGNPRLYEIMKEKDELYAKPDFSEEDGERCRFVGRLLLNRRLVREDHQRHLDGVRIARRVIGI